ncbi:MAG: ABC transporter ATP-binding protein [Duodenibacillus sp.]|nr:ABC transporter ATP-binding protein [Duodenibacillus sp.]
MESKARRPGLMRGRASAFDEHERAENLSATRRRLLGYFAHDRLFVCGIFAAILAATGFDLAVPALQSRAIDVIAGQSSEPFLPLIALMFALASLAGLLGFARDWLSARLGQRLIGRLRDELFTRIVRLPVGYIDRHSHGDLMSRMTNDIDNISNTVSMALPTLFSGVLTLAGTVSVMLWFSWQLTLVACSTIVLTALSLSLLAKPVRSTTRVRQNLLGALNGKAEETISAYRSVVANGQQARMSREFETASDELTRASVKSETLAGILNPLMNAVSNGGYILIAACGGFFALEGLITVGVIAAFLRYARQFSRPVNELAVVWGQLQTAIAGAERVFAVLDEACEEMQGETLELEGSADIEFCDVTFGYDPQKPVIRNFSLKVPAGRTVALVGATGSGKTTIANLLLRFYDPQGGRILVSGRDISRVSRESLRRQTAIVLQDTVLFAGTIRENLSYARAQASEDELWRAARLSWCDELIEMLPGKLDAKLTGSGTLSAGERQLLSIARGFVADPRILILDEATSSVDTRTEKAVQSAIREVMANRTSLVIAHRLSTIRDADLIVVMDAGRIVEQGTHAELMQRGGRYRELYEMQFAGLAT